MTEHAAVLFANDAFYLAINQRDIAAMSVVWAQRSPVVCIHPGWHPLHGRDAVLDAWQAILRNDQMPTIFCSQARATIWGNVAAVLCYESVGNVALAATNLFIQEAGTWKMIHHQAGPAPGIPVAGETEPPPTVQ